MTFIRSSPYKHETLKYFADQCLEFSIDTLNDFGILMFRNDQVEKNLAFQCCAKLV